MADAPTPRAPAPDWWVVPARRPDARVRLFCFPYAGGSAPSYHRFAHALPTDIEVCSLQAPGRGFRLRERGFDRLDALLAEVTPAIVPRLDRPYALFGHSMGGLVAFELARRLRSERRAAPVHLFVSATPPPESTPRRLAAPGLTDEQLWAAVQALYGLPVQPPEPALLELALPPLKDDLAMLSSYEHRPDEPLDTPLTALYASADPMVDRAAAERWSAHTRGRFAVREVPGRHLYLQDAPAVLVAEVRAALGL